MEPVRRAAASTARACATGIRARFHALVDHAGLDEHRARDWVVVRMMDNAVQRLQDPPEARRLISTEDYLTLCVAVAKAVQD